MFRLYLEGTTLKQSTFQVNAAAEALNRLPNAPNLTRNDLKSLRDVVGGCICHNTRAPSSFRSKFEYFKSVPYNRQTVHVLKKSTKDKIDLIFTQNYDEITKKYR